MSESWDFVVVGSGAGSMCAALVLRKAGKRVLVLEKSALAGGTTATSGGVMWIPANRFMREAGVADSAADALAYLDAVVGSESTMPGATRARHRAFVDQAPRMVDFLVENGIRLRSLPSWPDHYDAPGRSDQRGLVSELYDIKQLGDWANKLRPGFLPLPANLDEAMLLPEMKRSWVAKKTLLRIVGRAIADRFTGRRRVTAGQALQAQMLKAALDAGAEVRLETPVTEIIVEGGRVVGVLANVNGRPQRFAATLGVLVNAGGFAKNQAMRDRYVPGTSTDWTLVPDCDTGEMIQEGMRIGAATAQLGERISYQMAMLPGETPKPATLQGDMSKPHAIVVDQSGERYVRESGATVDFCAAMVARNRTVPAIPSWMIVDSQFINKYMLAGTMPGAKKPQAWTDTGFLKRGDTLEALATNCSIDPQRLKATVERFNGFARAGRDDDFGRGDSAYDRWLGDALHTPSPSLGTLEVGPFYAIQVVPGDVSTFGGLVTDTQARVLRPDGSAIPGLYATGTSTASMMGQVEAGGGGSIGPAMTWAWIAAHDALAQGAGAAAAA